MSEIRSAVIVDAVRSPMGKGRDTGALHPLHPVDLLAQTLKAIVDRNDIDPGTVEDAIIGCVGQIGEQSATPGRMALLAAGFPEHVPATTIDRKCGSSQQAVQFAAHGVMVGHYDIVIAGGIESMSRVVMGSPRAGKDPYGAGVNQRYAPGLLSQGMAAELVADKWALTRRELDECAVRSHLLAADAAANGRFDHEIVPIHVPLAADDDDPGFTEAHTVTADETIRPNSSVEKLGELKTVFDTPAHRERFPDLEFRVTAGNSSQMVDGASAMLIMSEQKARELGLTPRARLHSFSQIGDDPMLMLTAIMPATKIVLDKAGMSIGDIDYFEVNEAFAPVPLAWQREFGVPDDKLNVHGGAIALGHPLGASGTRLMTTLLNILEQRDAQWGLQTMCEAGGMANATIIERL